jgi:hypothetical protein
VNVCDYDDDQSFPSLSSFLSPSLPPSLPSFLTIVAVGPAERVEVAGPLLNLLEGR